MSLTLNTPEMKMNTLSHSIANIEDIALMVMINYIAGLAKREKLELNDDMYGNSQHLICA